MKYRQWYAAEVRADFGTFEADEVCYVRKLELSVPLALGDVTIMFNPRQFKSVRVANCIGLQTVFTLWPNNVIPKPAPTDKNLEIEQAYRMYLRQNPIAKRTQRSCE